MLSQRSTAGVNAEETSGEPAASVRRQERSCYANTAKRFSPMQSIFSLSARRASRLDLMNHDRRDGRLKMDWTKPRQDARPMGIEWLAGS